MNTALTTLLWTALGFLLGAMPFSLWLGRLALHTDVRRYGDGNPGATNAWRAGGWRVGVPVLLLDYLKGAVPVGMAHFTYGISGWALVPVALAPVLGHAFSPFLRFRGGKAVAATFGAWTGLTLGEVPMLLGLLLGFFLAVQTADAWSVMLGMAGILVHLLLRHSPPFILAIWAGNVLLLVWKHRHDLRQPIRLRPWILNLLRRNR
jgi:glycerol-3-phosphate acyltransferase PlsY